jgi:hypothetical protein
VHFGIESERVDCVVRRSGQMVIFVGGEPVEVKAVVGRIQHRYLSIRGRLLDVGKGLERCQPVDVDTLAVAVEDPAPHNPRSYLSQPSLQFGGMLHDVEDVHERIEIEATTFPYKIVEVAVDGVNELRRRRAMRGELSDVWDDLIKDDMKESVRG